MEAKIENDKNLEKIRNLEEKIELLESEKGGTLYDIDDVVNEYNKSKEKFTSHQNEIENIQKKIEVEQNNTKTIKEEKLNEINTLKAEII